MKTEFDVLGIGNVLMDIIAPVADNFLTDNVIEKGSMTLIDEPRALALNTALKKASGVQEIAGRRSRNCGRVSGQYDVWDWGAGPTRGLSGQCRR